MRQSNFASSSFQHLALAHAEQVRAASCEVLASEVQRLEQQVADLQRALKTKKKLLKTASVERSRTSSGSMTSPGGRAVSWRHDRYALSEMQPGPNLDALTLPSVAGLQRLMQSWLPPPKGPDKKRQLLSTPVSMRAPARLVSENAAAARIQAAWRMWRMRSRYNEFRVVAAVTGSELLPTGGAVGGLEALLCQEAAVCVFQVTVLHGQHARQVRHRYSDWLRLHERLQRQPDWQPSLGFPPKLPLPASWAVRRLREQQLHDYLSGVLLWARRREGLPRDLLRFLTVDHLYWAYEAPVPPGCTRMNTPMLLRHL